LVASFSAALLGRGKRVRHSALVRRLWVALLGVGLLASACGTRVPGEIAALHSSNGGGSGGSSGGSSGPGVDGASSAISRGSSSQTVGTGSGTGTPAASVASGSAGAVSNGPVVSGSGPQTSTVGPQAPVLVGEVGNWSGVVGSALAPARDAFGAWAASVNARGGILGHPIKVLVADDGGDPATNMSEIRDMVENRHVIVLANLYPPVVNDPSVAKYAEQKGIPVVGIPDGDRSWYQSPVAFPMVASGDADVYGDAKAMADSGAKKVGVAYCSEVPICKLGEQAWVHYASQLGLQIVYDGQISVVQPDYTAQCLQAQGKGAQALIVFADAASVGRFADSCTRQTYRPMFINPLAQADDAHRPSLDGSVSVLSAFPWFVTSGSPALNEYGQAMAQYNRNPVGGLSGTGWVTGKGVERALEISLARSPVPSSAALFQALWTFRGETLGGLAPPLSFYQGRPPAEVVCTFEAKVSGGRWVAPQGARTTFCKP
jgi:branched-chain amino acid transport system substrate-binding protein